MKKKLALLMAAALAVSMLAGCGSKAEEKADEGQAQEETAAQDTEAEEEKSAYDAIEKAYLKDYNAADYVTLGEYKGLEISASRQDVTDDYVDMYMEYIRANSPVTAEVTDRGVQVGDTVNIDFVGKIDGVAFEGGTAAAQSLTIGSGRYIEGFEEGLVGANVGQKVELNLVFPEDYTNADVAGKDVVFYVTVNSITEQKTPELDDAYVQGLAIEGVTNVEEYTDYIREELTADAQSTYEDDLSNAAVNAAMEVSEFEEMPEALMNYYVEIFKLNITQQAQMYGMDVEQYMQLMVSSGDFESEDSDGIIRELALKSAKQSMLFAAIADAEGLHVTDEEMAEKMEQDAADAGYESAEAYEAVIDTEAYREYLMSEKVVDFLVENANVTELEGDNPAEAVEKARQEAAAEADARDAEKAQESDDAADADAQDNAADASEDAADGAE